MSPPPPSPLVMCVCYKSVNWQNQLQHCLCQFQANAWLLSVTPRFSCSSIASSLHRSLQQSDGSMMQTCASEVRPYFALNKYSIASVP